MVDNPLQKRLRDLQYTIWRYAPLLWRFPETRKNFFRVVWRRPLLIIKWLLVIAGIIVVPIILVKFILVGYSLPFTGFNGEHVTKLPEGNVKIVDLRGANFSNLRIHETTLSSDYLQVTGCRLSLRNANLEGAIFRDASLEQIDLRDACLDEAYISQADLNGTWLCQASMELTRLHGTNLHGACLR